MEPGRYAELLLAAQCGSPHLSPEKERELLLDLDRTCPPLGFFSDDGGGRAGLANVLRAWVVYDAEEAEAAKQERVAASPVDSDSSEACKVSPVGYVQGMNFIATALLWHAGHDEAAFWLFVAMLQHYGLRSMFEAPDMHGLKVRCYTMAQLLHQQMPDLSAHLAEYLRNSLSLLLTEWLLTLFASSVPLGPLAALWDYFFEDGYSAVYRMVLARLRCLQPWLLAETDFASLVYLVKEVHVEFDYSLEGLRPRLPTGTPNSSGNTTGEGSDSVGGYRRPRRPPLITRFGRPRDTTPAAASFAAACGHSAASTAEATGCSFQSLSGYSHSDSPTAQAQASAWICAACEGTEQCRSWEVLVAAWLAAERIPGSSISHFERMFGSEQEQAIEVPSPAQASTAREQLKGAEVASAVMLPLPEADEAEVVRLRRENAALRSELGVARQELVEARRELSETRLRSRAVFRALLGCGVAPPRLHTPLGSQDEGG